MKSGVSAKNKPKKRCFENSSIKIGSNKKFRVLKNILQTPSSIETKKVKSHFYVAIALTKV